MPEVAGKVNVVLSVNAVNFTAAMKEAQANLDKFSGKAKSSGHSAVTSVQAVSASLRTMHGGFEQNLRSMERWVAQSATATKVAQKLFPLVGAGTFAVMIGEIGMKVVDFVQKANAMPKAIQMGFASLQLSTQSSTDSLRLTNDQLQNSINKLEGKPVNNLAIQFDEATKAADKCAASIESGNNKINQLLSANHMSAWSILTGHVGTADREGTIKYFGDKQDDNAISLANATRNGDKAGVDKANADTKNTQNDELKSLRGDLSTRESNSKNTGAFDDSANISIDKGAIREILNQQNEQAEELRNAKLASQKQSLDDAKQQSEASKKAATDRVAAMQTQLVAMKLQYGMSLKATYDYWEGMKAGELAGGTAYNLIVKNQAQLAVQAATEAHAKIEAARKKFITDSADNATTGVGLINEAHKESQRRAEKTSNNQDADARGNNQQSILEANNTARIKETQINEEAGDSMTRYAAAVALANVHAEQLKATLLGLSANVDIAQRAYDAVNTPGGDPENIRQAKSQLNQAQNAYSNEQVSGQIRGMQDQQAIDPGFTSATTGAKDALNDFVMASRDSASMMRELVNNTLNGLNDQIINGLTGGKTDFKQVAAGATRGVADAGLKKAEGNVISLFGGGKLGTKGNPMSVTIEGGSHGGGIPGGFSAGDSGSDPLGIKNIGKNISGISAKGGGGFLGFFKGLLGAAAGAGGAGGSIPFPAFANGGTINGPSIVGEQGEEVWTPPEAGGKIIPNRDVSAALGSGSGGNINYTIDARGTDAVQVQSRVKAAIAQSHQSSVHQAVIQQQQKSLRQPSRSR